MYNLSSFFFFYLRQGLTSCPGWPGICDVTASQPPECWDCGHVPPRLACLPVFKLREYQSVCGGIWLGVAYGEGVGVGYFSSSQPLAGLERAVTSSFSDPHLCLVSVN
jgi:hypothetical protein